ncbi:MAG: hypothetical protein IKF71_02010 [Bacilli bacterium]|nr:hypothetical protein [Bacilli bacterium]
MKKRIIIIPLLLLTGLLLTGCDIGTKKTKVQEVPQVSITAEEMKDLERVSELVFTMENESLKTEDLTEAKKAEIARRLQKDFTSVSGTKMEEDFKKYFGRDQFVLFDNIPCGMEHENEEENIMLFFDNEQDRYVYNDKHPGHGGGWSDTISFEMSFDNITVIGKEYHYDVKVFFFGKYGCGDVGTCTWGKAYKTYEDAKNGTNPMIDIDNNRDYMKDTSGPPQADLSIVMEDIRENLDTYEFVYKKVDGYPVFQSYSKK